MKYLTKKERVKLLLELDNLIRCNGDKERIKELRGILDDKIDKYKKQKLSVDDKDKELLKYREDEKLVNSVCKLLAMGMTHPEIAFILSISTVTIRNKLNKFTEDEIDSKMQEYKSHSVYVNYIKQRNKRWKNL